MQNNENIDKSIYLIEDAINRKHIKYYELEILKIFKRLVLDLLERFFVQIGKIMIIIILY